MIINFNLERTNINLSLSRLETYFNEIELEAKELNEKIKNLELENAKLRSELNAR